MPLLRPKTRLRAGRKTGVGAVPSSRDLPHPGMEPAALTSPVGFQILSTVGYYTMLNTVACVVQQVRAVYLS